MLSLHDHFVREFTVDADAKTLRLGTAYPEVGGPKRAEGIFEGVEAYVILGDALGTIIFDIEEVDSLSLYDDFAASMREVCRRSGGHAHWVETRERAEQFLRGNHIKGYSLSSSIGFNGAVWVVCRTLAHDAERRSLTRP